MELALAGLALAIDQEHYELTKILTAKLRKNNLINTMNVVIVAYLIFGCFISCAHGLIATY